MAHQDTNNNNNISGSDAAPPLYVQRLRASAVLPTRQTAGAAGYDLYCDEDAAVIIPPGEWRCVRTGVAVTVPDGTYGRVAPRSGLSCKGTHVGAGVVDRDYTGEIKVLLFNMNREVEISVSGGDRIAQLVVTKISTPEVVEVESLESTARGEGGFGSTGV
jgi:dUTP pyrophosphatase